MSIGRKVKVFEDDSRKEIYSKRDETRKVIISMYYPLAKDIPAKSSLYMDLYAPNQVEFVNKHNRGQVEKNKHLLSLRTKIFNDEPMLKEPVKKPVIIMSHGLGAGRDSYSFLVERLVEAGYYVVAVGHLYDALWTVLPCGRNIHFGEKLIDSSDTVRRELLGTRRQDLLYILDKLDEINEHFNGQIDTSRIGGVGHSLGGYALLECAAFDERIKSLVMLDGSMMYFDLEDQAVINNKHILNITRDLHNTEKNDPTSKKRELFLETFYVNGAMVELEAVDHVSFSDFYSINPELRNEDIMNPEDCHTIVSDVTIEYLDNILMTDKNN